MPKRYSFAALLALAPLLPGCGDSTVCIFTSQGCQGGSSGPGSGPPAVLPGDGQVILTAAPTASVFPTGPGAAPTTPIVVLFSESMSAASLIGTIELFQVDIGATIGPLPQSLLAGGRVLVLFPPTDLPPSTYEIRVGAAATVTDLTGQELVGGALLGTFLVDGTEGTVPRLLASSPDVSGGSVTVETTPQLVFVFDRHIDLATVSPLSFDFEVDLLNPDPSASPVPILFSDDGFPLPGDRVFQYRFESGGAAASLGTGASVVVTLSPPPPLGTDIQDIDGFALPQTTLSFLTQNLEPPLAAFVLSTPIDGIGIDNLTPGHPEELTLQVDLIDAQPGDVLSLTLFGTFDDPDDPQLIALARTKSLTGIGTITVATLSLAEIDIVNANFADGTVAFALNLVRASQVTPVRLLDVDANAPGIQDPLLDTVRPTVDDLLYPSGTTGVFHSDLRNLVLAGDASETLRAIEVTAGGLDNGGVRPPVVGSDSDGLFIAAPVPLDVIPVGTQVAYTLTVYDAVLNASDPALGPIPGLFRQLGVVGPVALAPAGTIEVEVFDANSLALLPNARVYTHEDLGDGVNFPLQDLQLTDANGLATLQSATNPLAIGTLLTVEAVGYDLFTFHGIGVDRISVPLRRDDLGVATVTGVLTTTSASGTIDLPALTLKYDDTRLFDTAEPTYAGGGCTTPPFGGPITCPYGPELIQPERLGALSFFAGELDLSAAAFDERDLLRAFDLQVPQAPTNGGDVDLTAIVVPFMLDETGVDPSEKPVELPAITLDAVFAAGLIGLAGDPDTTGDPFVTVEALIPGIPGAVTVGQGLAFGPTGLTWNVRSAIPGAVAVGGFFETMGTIDPDLFLRAELRDSAGSRVGRRPRLSALPGLPGNTLFLPRVPTVIAPPSLATVGPSFSVSFENAIIDATLQNGLYVVTLVDSTLRRWTLVLGDPPDAVAAPFMHLPDIRLDGGVPLLDGLLVCSVSAFAWPGFSTTDFLFTDIAREHDVFGASAPIVYTQMTPP